MPFIILLAVILFALMGGIYLYNGLVTRRVRCREAWSLIDVQLKRRYDLIPNLVATVKGYAAHERQTLEAVVEARNAAMAAKGVARQSEAEAALSGSLRQLFALSESYPALKANENFAELQEELTTTENKIAFARQQYNDAAGAYNAAREQFPANLVAGMFAFRPADYFQLEEPKAEEPPKVEF